MTDDTRTVRADEPHAIGEICPIYQTVNGRGVVRLHIGTVHEGGWDNIRYSNHGRGRVVACEQTDPYTWTLTVDLLPDEA